ncbi:carbonic anhydrase [Lactarius akahatsu]|uniref:Carbonic anhydrase n=1 Tax=Lactarius akahatsu TaxID=416441 RepID=A0AAD4L7D8_9AGAM|nr:carbonic anhydrase [Lactarius akahatsu]KAH8982966.1 carbonic anhydrase [Lactarius akahatsu]
MPSRALSVKAVLCATTTTSGSKPRWSDRSGTGSRPRAHHVAALPLLANPIRRASAPLSLPLSILDGSFLSTPRRHHHKSNPMDATLAKIFSANAQWAEAVNTADPDFFRLSAKGQTPKVLWLGCSDSRVPESVLTASRPGDIFVHRNIANQIHPDDASALAAITYAVAHVRVEHILVVGHTRCGGADAALKAVAGTLGTVEPVLERWLTPLIELASKLNSEAASDPLTRLVEESVRVQVENVANSEPVRKVWEGQKNLWVHGLVYDLETGTLRDLNVTKGRQS